MGLTRVEQERLRYAKDRLFNKQQEERLLNLKHIQLNEEIKRLIDAIKTLNSKENLIT